MNNLVTFGLICILAALICSAQRPGTGTGTGSKWGSGGGFRPSSGGRCQWVRGHVKCANNKGDHDKNHVVVRLLDGGRTVDEGYSSQNGQFAVFGCGISSPELHVLHFCKANRARDLTLPVPSSAGPEYNITSVIDLKGFHQQEADFQDHVKLPCVQ